MRYNFAKLTKSFFKNKRKAISYLNIILLFFLINNIFTRELYINDSGAIDSLTIETSDKKLKNVINNTNGVFTTNTKFNGTSKCVGSYFYERQIDTSRKLLLDMNDLCQYKSGKYEFYLHFTSKKFDTNKMMSVKVPIKSGTGPFKLLNGTICKAAWVVFNNEGHLPSYLMKAKCDISDDVYKKIEQNF